MSSPAPAGRTAGRDDPVVRTFQAVLGRPGEIVLTTGATQVLNVILMPGAAFLADVEDDRALRLSISNPTPDSIDEGLTRLSKAVATTPTHAAAR